MGTTRFEGSVNIPERLTVGYFDPPAQSIDNAAIKTGAGIQAEKLEHWTPIHWQKDGSVASATVVLCRIHGATADSFEVYAGSVAVAIGDSTVTVDIKKNGTTMLTGSPVTFNSSNVAYTAVTLNPTTTTAVVGDVITAVLVATVGTGTLPTGFFISGRINEVHT